MENLILDKDCIEFDYFFSDEDCDKYITYIDKLFEDNLDEDGLEVDGYNRLRVSNIELSKVIESKLQEKYNISDVYLGDKWFPTKYIKNGGLCIHSDGSAYDENETSLYTLIIYLNDNYSGGRTVFVNDYDDDEIVTEKSIYITPKKGKLLILRQNVLHYAEKVENGIKYILRGDIYKIK